jgi:hypothetical protein
MTTPIIPESLAPAFGSAGEACASCGATLAVDQRYCLHCGRPRTSARVDFWSELGLHANAPAGVRGVPQGAGAASRDDRAPLVAVLGTVALLLALGIGVLIGREGQSSSPSRPTVVTVPAAAPAAATAAPLVTGPPTDDWPAPSSGYTVELQTLDRSALSSDVNAAKSAAAAKGATDVGVLDGSAHSGTPADKYVIYSGHYDSESAARKQAAQLAASFPGAIALHVTPAGSGSDGGTAQASPTPTPTPKLSGKAYEDKSKKLPAKVGTGGAPPAKDKKKAGGGTSATEIG